MPTIAAVEKFASDEYDWLCQKLGLTRVRQFHIFEHVDGSTAPVFSYLDDSGASQIVVHGCPSAGYRPGVLFVSVDAPDLSPIIALPKAAPPETWMATRDWPRWRADLWHEVCHQVQHQTLDKWDRYDDADGHLSGWSEALLVVARNMPMDQRGFEYFVDTIWGPAERGLVNRKLHPERWSCPRL